MTPARSWAIVVNVGHPDDACLLDIPFNGEHRIHEAVRTAVARISHDTHVPLRCLRLDEKPVGSDITREVIQQTRKARLVVAVCSPQRTRVPVPNPNVMFELGLATALGKPVLIISNGAHLPVDIRNYHALICQRHETAASLAARIESEMRSVLGSLTNPIVRPAADGIWAAEARQEILLRPAFWRSYSVLFRHANCLRNQMELLHGNHAHDFQKHAWDIALGRDVVASFKQTWQQYLAEYGNAGALDLPDDFSNAFTVLHDMAVRERDQEQINKIGEYIELVRTGIELLRGTHEALKKRCESFFSENCDAHTRPELRKDIFALGDAVKALVVYSTGLVDLLVELVASGFTQRPDTPLTMAQMAGGPP